MNFFFFQFQLSVIAQRWAEQCPSHDGRDKIRDVDRFQVGQNVFRTAESKTAIPINWKEAIHAWFDEVVKASSEKSVDTYR